MEYLFIVNPIAGAGYALKVMEQIGSILKERKIAFRSEKTENQGDATQIAKAASGRPDRIIAAVGGDGTVREVAAGLMGTESVMGIIPAGTGNDLIKAAGIPKDPLQALELLLQGNPKKVDAGLINQESFMNICGTGFDVTVLEYTEAYKARFRGLTPYMLGLLKAVFHYKPCRLAITADGKTEEDEYLICAIANGRCFGGGIPICPVADLRDGLLDLVLVKNIPRWKIPFYLPGLMMSRVLNFRITKHCLVRNVSLRGEGLRINIDGEIKPMERAEFRIDPAALRLICP